MTDEVFRDTDRQMLQKHDQDLYRGNGKRGITSRLDTLEDGMHDQALDISLLKEHREASMLFISEVRSNNVQREKLLKVVAWLVGTLITLGLLLLAMLTYEHTTGKSVIQLKSDVMNAERLQANPWR